VDINALYEFALPILVITILAALTKAFACAAGALFAKLPLHDSLLIGVGMIPRGEVALIVASIGLTSGILTAAQYSIISAMALLTTFIVPLVLARMLKK
jgi:Kef-type K+ transport system membrane component KefB